MHRGYIKLWRKIEDWEWYDDSLTLWFFIHLVMMANWTDKQWHGITIKRGQFISSVENLRLVQGVGNRKRRLTTMCVRTLIQRLKDSHVLTTNSTNTFTLYTIVNYELYQDNETNLTSKVPSELANEQQTDNKRITTTKELIRTNKKDNILQEPNGSLFSIDHITTPAVAIPRKRSKYHQAIDYFVLKHKEVCGVNYIVTNWGKQTKNIKPLVDELNRIDFNQAVDNYFDSSLAESKSYSLEFFISTINQWRPKDEQ